LLDAVRVPAPPALKAIAKIKVESPDETFSVKELIVAQAPDRLRLETLSPLGQPGFYAATDGQDLFLFAPSENTYYRGEATPRNLGLIFPLNLGVEDMVSVIRGYVPLIDYDADYLHCTVKESGYVIQLKGRDENTTQVLTLARDDLRVVSSETYDRATLTCAVTYEDYQPAGNTAFPRAITVSLPSDQTTVRIHYKNVEFLPEIDSSLFRLSVPQGAKIVPLE
jgi:outer membrane lipoprotein-sorting protein